MYEIKFHRRIAKDIERLKAAKLGEKAKRLIEIVKINPFQNPPPYEKLVGNLHGTLFAQDKCTAQNGLRRERTKEAGSCFEYVDALRKHLTGD